MYEFLLNRHAFKLGFYHLGTLAYSSLILPCYAILNFVFELFYVIQNNLCHF